MKSRRLLPIICLLIILPVLSSARDRYERLERQIPYEKLQELEVEIDIGLADLILGKVLGNNLLEASITYDNRYQEPEIKFKKTGNIGSLTIDSGERDEDVDYKNGNRKDEHWELLFSSNIPIRFILDLGLVDGNLDMTELKIIGLELSGGLSELNLVFDKPNSELIDEIKVEIGLGTLTTKNLGNANFQRLKLENGLGSARLDLRGEWRVRRCRLDLEVGLGSAKVEIPSSLAVEIEREENFLSSINLDRSLREVRDGLYRTSNWDDAAHQLVVNADVGLGSVKIKIVD